MLETIEIAISLSAYIYSPAAAAMLIRLHAWRRL
jgi:hypothetical protein